MYFFFVQTSEGYQRQKQVVWFYFNGVEGLCLFGKFCFVNEAE